MAVGTVESMSVAQLRTLSEAQGIKVGAKTSRATMLQRLQLQLAHPPKRSSNAPVRGSTSARAGTAIDPPRTRKRGLVASTDGVVPADSAASKRARSISAAPVDDEDEDNFLEPIEVPILPRNTFHGQIRLAAGFRPPMRGLVVGGSRQAVNGGKGAGCKRWKSALLLNGQHFQTFLGAICSTTYSKTSGKGGAPVEVPVKWAKPKWGKQAVLVVVSRSPFARHSLSIDRRAAGKYMAFAGLKEKRDLAAPSGLGSFDACIFDLADSEQNVVMGLQGKGDYLSKPCEPLPNGPEWE